MNHLFDLVTHRLQTASEKWDSLQERFGATDLLPMWVADMDFLSPPPVIEALEKRMKHGIFGYTRYEPSLLTAIQSWFHHRHGWDFQTDWICHSPGIVTGISLLIDALTKPGDGILIQPPVYHPFAHIVKGHHRKLVENQLVEQNGTYVMDFVDLEAKLASGVKMMILCNPHNPVGRVWRRDELQQLGDLCKKYDVLVISDEIHCDLLFPGHHFTPFLSVDPSFADFTISCLAPSKTFNLAGLYTSFLVIPQLNLRKAYKSISQRFSIGHANVFGVIAAEAAYQSGAGWLDDLLVYLTDNLRYLREFVQTFFPELRVIEPEGTYLVWIDFRNLGLSDKELDHFLLRQAKVGLNEGHSFGKGGEGFMRMNIACPRELLKEGLQRIHTAWTNYSPTG